MDKPTLTFGSLFAGIGGIDLGLERAGMRCEWQVENNEFCQKVLAKHWPDVARHGDVRNVGKHNLSRVDLIAGGFPCQPHSNAGERKASQDERDLWPEFYRLIRELEPRWVVAENVLGLLSSEDGAFFGGILRDLAQAGYDARWQVLSAAQFGAPHLRERVILVAYHTGVGSGAWWAESAGLIGQAITDCNGTADVAHADSDDRRRTQRANAGGMACQGRAHAERKGYPQRDAYQCSGTPLAYASSPEWWASAERWRHVFDWANTGWQEAPGGSELCCEELADASEQGLPIRGCTGYPTNGAQTGAGLESQPERHGELANPDRQGLAVGVRIGRDARQECTPIERDSNSPIRARTVESGLGRATHGLSSWLDRYRWPARPGQSQEELEAPRVVTEKRINRTARLKGLGNAVVPALAEYVGRCIMAAEAERQAVA